MGTVMISAAQGWTAGCGEAMRAKEQTSDFHMLPLSPEPAVWEVPAGNVELRMTLHEFPTESTAGDTRYSFLDSTPSLTTTESNPSSVGIHNL